jgi:transposase-like protein
MKEELRRLGKEVTRLKMGRDILKKATISLPKSRSEIPHRGELGGRWLESFRACQLTLINQAVAS